MSPEYIPSHEPEDGNLRVVKINLGEEIFTCDQFTAVCTVDTIYYAGNKARESAYKDHIPHSRVAYEAHLHDDQIVGAFVLYRHDDVFSVSGSHTYSDLLDQKFIDKLKDEIIAST